MDTLENVAQLCLCATSSRHIHVHFPRFYVVHELDGHAHTLLIVGYVRVLRVVSVFLLRYYNLFSKERRMRIGKRNKSG